MNIDLAELRERIREALPLAEVMGRDVKLKREGSGSAGSGKFRCLCPFHAEKSPSFVVGGKRPDRGHCFGCGEDVDIFSYWMKTRSVEFLEAVVALGDMAGVIIPPQIRSPLFVSAPKPVKIARSPERLVRGDESDSVKPSLPPMRALKRAECEQLAKGRGLSVDAVRCAAFSFHLIGFSMWPLYEGGYFEAADGRALRGRLWHPRSQGAWPSWVVTDPTRNVAEFRRLDNEKYPKHDGSAIKAWSTAGKNWPIGAAQIGHRVNVLMVEGGPDLLAAYHFLLRWGMCGSVAVVCMLGASNRIRPEALPAFKGKRVRIMMDADSIKDDGSAPGLEATVRWQRQLTEAGAVVEPFSLYGLTLPDGSAVKDINDLAKCSDEVTAAPHIRDAFCAWDF